MKTESYRYFSTPSLSGLMQQVKHLSLFGADALVVEGESGSGKSSFISALSAELESQEYREVALDLVCVSLSEDEDILTLLSSLSSALGLSSGAASVGAILSQIRSFSEALIDEHRVALVIFDDAQYLGDDALGALASLLQSDAEGGFGMRFLFFSEPGLIERVDALELLNLTIYDFQLEAFSAEEIGRFLEEKTPSFSELLGSGSLPSISAIWNRSSGYPGRALSIVNDCMVDSSDSQVGRRPLRMPLLHIIVLSGLVAALLTTLLYRGDQSNDNSITQTRELVSPESRVSAGPASPKPAIIIAPSDDVEETVKSVATESSDPISILYTEESQVSMDASSEPPGNDIVIDSGQDPSLIVDVVEQEDIADEVGREGASVPLMVDIHPTPKKTLLTGSEQELMNGPEDGYVLQLVAASKKGTLQNFVDKQSNKDQIHIYRRAKSESDTWYIVVVGPYSSKSKAQLAIKNLPEQQRKGGPWPKSMLSVHKEIADFRDR